MWFAVSQNACAEIKNKELFLLLFVSFSGLRDIYSLATQQKDSLTTKKAFGTMAFNSFSAANLSHQKTIRVNRHMRNIPIGRSFRNNVTSAGALGLFPKQISNFANSWIF